MAYGKLPFGLVKKMEMQDRVKQTCFSPLEFPEDGRKVIDPALKDLLTKVTFYDVIRICANMTYEDARQRPEEKANGEGSSAAPILRHHVCFLLSRFCSC